MQRHFLRLSQRTSTFQTRRPSHLFSIPPPASRATLAHQRASIQTINFSPVKLLASPDPPYPTDDPYQRFDGAWADEISVNGGGIGPSGNARIAGWIAFRCSYGGGEVRWREFKSKFEKLMLMQWEHEASEGADPCQSRKYFKVFWVEDKAELDGRGPRAEDLSLLRKKYKQLVDSKDSSSVWHTMPPLSPALNSFLFIDEESITSLLVGPEKGEIPFAYAVSRGDDDDGYRSEDEVEDPMDPEQHYKVAIELLGWYWSLAGIGMRGMDSYLPKEVGGILKEIYPVCRLYNTGELLEVKKRILSEQDES